MFMPTVMNDNLFDDWFDDDFYMPAFPDMSWMDKKLYGGKAAHEMKTDVKETDNSYELEVDLPGFKKDEVKLQLSDGYLTISAEKGLDKDEKKHGRLIRQERYEGAMQRSFYVGDGLTEDDVKASFANGVLKISLPKAEAKKALPEESYIEIEG